MRLRLTSHRFAAMLGLALAFTGLLASSAIAQSATPAPTSAGGRVCAPIPFGAGDKPGPDVDNALSAYSDLEGFLDTYHVRGEVLSVAIDLSKSPAALALIADSAADIPLIEKNVPKNFENVPTEVIMRKPYGKFLPYMLRTRGLSRAPNPPAGCPQPNEQLRADLDVIRAMAARVDLLAGLADQFSPKGGVEGIGINLSSSTAALNVTVTSSLDLDPDHLVFPASYEGVPVEQEVIGTSGDTINPGPLPRVAASPAILKRGHEWRSLVGVGDVELVAAKNGSKELWVHVNRYFEESCRSQIPPSVDGVPVVILPGFPPGPEADAFGEGCSSTVAKTPEDCRRLIQEEHEAAEKAQAKREADEKVYSVAVNKYAEAWLAQPGVLGIGPSKCDADACDFSSVGIIVQSKLEDVARSKIASSVDGVPVVLTPQD
ncbi:MAG: hypothetical protein ACLQAT_26425 [Candidatus Binataceae bacterium]